MSSNNRSRLYKGAGWVGATRILMNLIAFVSTIVLARLLLPDDFGIVAIAESISVIVTSVTELSLAKALIQHSDPRRRHFDTAWTLNITRSMILGGVVAAISVPVAAAYGDERLVPLLIVLGATVVASGLDNPKVVIFQRNLVFWQETLLGVIPKLLGFISALAIAVIFESFWALVAGSVVAQVSRIAISYILAPYLPRLTFAAYRELLSFSIWLTFSELIKTVNFRSDTLVLGAFVGPTPLGYYSYGGKLAYLPVRESLGPIRQLLFPAFSLIKGEMYRLRAAYMQSQGVLCTLAFPIGIGFAVLAEPIIRLLIGEKWLPIAPIVQVLGVVSAIQTIENSQPLAMSLGRTKRIFTRELRVFLIRIPLVILGLIVGQYPFIGIIMAVVLARAAANIVNIFLNLQLVRDVINLPIRKQLKVVMRPVLASLAMTAGLALAQIKFETPSSSVEGLLALSLLIALGGLFYVGSLSILWLIAGRPDGPEREILGLFEKVWKRALRPSHR
ncbi:lipopolysaccharide biosynthesis protein [Croceicoccus marinus]|uniref:Lipopolysaccharide biosynthesis protein n=1 Tax=Croceicoccus marinus TaxID=450378 RepID=A0A7G6VSZ4_9SPHN|nr:lipopolysaccharide biosynthesis protein [Croceicoccus marinus]QNE04859.1 lipopolysaccharide biosynthesis protein [Croceicoccus marinus]